jgi:hypothetical protein
MVTAYSLGTSAQSAASGKGRVSSVNGMSSSLVVARTAPASEDGVQLGGVKRPCVLTVREPAETSGAVWRDELR